VPAPDGKPAPAPPGQQSVYTIVPCEDPAVRETFLPGRRASVLLAVKGGPWQTVGCFGVVHPEVLGKGKFDLDFPCSAVELNLEPLL